MADKKISALTAASTPLAGTEVLPIVQSGSTVKVAVSDLTAGRAVSAKTITGNALTDATVASWNSNNGTYGLDIGYSYNSSRIGSAGSAKGIDGTRALTDFGLHGINNLEFFTGYTYRGKWDSNGNFVIGAANKGVNFTANTPAAGMTSQLLNWYEEGTWTPTIIGSSSAGTGTYTLQEGHYTRIGRQVTVTCAITWTAHTGTGVLRVSGLPFTIKNDNVYAAFALEYANLTVSANAIACIVTRPGQTYLQVDETVAGGASQSGVTLDTAASLYFSVTYFV